MVGWESHPPLPPPPLPKKKNSEIQNCRGEFLKVSEIEIKQIFKQTVSFQRIYLTIRHTYQQLNI